MKYLLKVDEALLMSLSNIVHHIGNGDHFEFQICKTNKQITVYKFIIPNDRSRVNGTCQCCLSDWSKCWLTHWNKHTSVYHYWDYLITSYKIVSMTSLVKPYSLYRYQLRFTSILEIIVILNLITTYRFAYDLEDIGFINIL